MIAKVLRARQKIGKYRIEKKIGEGGFANVYAATDTIEGQKVAIKIPHEYHVSPELLNQFKQEVRLASKLEHPNVLGLKDASIIDGRFIVVSLLGEQTLDERLSKRISFLRAMDYASQMIAAVSYSHQLGIIHCDIKPDNFIMFDGGDRIRLTDFGIAKVSKRTIEGSGTGTVGHMAPEQAMGKPSFRSDVFSLGLILYRMFSGYWPEYPFDWPPPGVPQMRKKHIHPELIAMMKKALSPKPRQRFSDATRMEAVFDQLHDKTIRNWKKHRS